MHDLTRRPCRISPAPEAPQRDGLLPGQGRDTLNPGARRFRAPPGMAPGAAAPRRAGAPGAMADVGAGLAALRRHISIYTPDGRPADAEFVVARLEEAGATLLSLPETGFSPRMRTGALAVVHSAAEAYGWSAARLRPAVPLPERITRMDETFAWLALVPDDRVVLRRLVSARALVSPLTGKHLYAWRRLGAVVGADHKAVQRWHAEGIKLIVRALNMG
jgi:hypothetical protein